MNKSKYKRTVTLLLSIVLVITGITSVGAQALVAPANPDYNEALSHLDALGIISVDTEGNLTRPDDFLTREELAKMLVVASNLEDTIDLYKERIAFLDVEPFRWSNSYINAAVENGFIRELPNGRFDPTGTVTFAKMYAVLVLILGYTQQDVSGSWPDNYIAKAKELGLTEGVVVKSDDLVPRWAAVVIINNLLEAEAKTSESDQHYHDYTGLYNDYIILADHYTNDDFAEGEIQTDKGILKNDTNINLEIGRKYLLKTDDDIIGQVYESVNVIEQVTAEYLLGNELTLINDEYTASMKLPVNTTYYYDGLKQSYDAVKSVIQKNTSIIFAWDTDKAFYEYAVVLDPVYSKPQLADATTAYSFKAGTIDLTGSPVLMAGFLTTVSAVTLNDVIYEVTDMWKNNRFISVVSDRIYGTLAGYTPSRYSPKTIEINSYNSALRKWEITSYEVSDDFDMSKISTFGIGAYLTLLLGYDGRVVSMTY